VKVQVKRGLGVTGHNLEVPEHVANRAVAMPGLVFRAVHCIVHLYVVADVSREHLSHSRQRSAFPGFHHGRRCDSPCVDHRIRRHAGRRVQTDRVERVPAFQRAKAEGDIRRRPEDADQAEDPVHAMQGDVEARVPSLKPR